MELSETHLVTAENGPRPAGPPDRCFYCDRSIGEEHGPGCALRLQRITVRFTLDYQIDIPAWWGPGELESHRNEGTWCTSNGIDEITARFADSESEDGQFTSAEIDPCAYSRYEWLSEDAPVPYGLYRETAHVHRTPPYDPIEERSAGNLKAESMGYVKRRYD